jgi:hypothetical protein
MKVPRSCAALLLLASCGSQSGDQVREDGRVEVPQPSGPPVVQQADDARETSPGVSGFAWQADDQSASLRLVGPAEKPVLVLTCSGSPAIMTVTAPGFSMIGSEDRFVLGLGEEPVTLVADMDGRKAPGVTARAPVPGNLAKLMNEAAEVSALYGTQRLGPVSAPPGRLRTDFLKSCSGG